MARLLLVVAVGNPNAEHEAHTSDRTLTEVLAVTISVVTAP
jgi:hypothetical protein